MPTRYLLGLILLLLGAGFLVEALYLPAYPLVARWWPVLLVLWGLNGLVRNIRRPFWSFIVLVIGILLIVRLNGLLEVNVGLVIGAVVLILIGLRIMIPRQERRIVTGGGAAMVHSEDQLNQSVTFGGTKIRVNSQAFRGGRVSVTFGGAEIDLREANLAPDGADLRLEAAFGGIEVRVPVGWPVQVSGAPALGGCEVHIQNTEIATPGSAALRITCSGVFSGIEIKN